MRKIILSIASVPFVRRHFLCLLKHFLSRKIEKKWIKHLFDNAREFFSWFWASGHSTTTCLNFHVSWSEDRANEGEKIDSVVTLHSVSGQFTFRTLAGMISSLQLASEQTLRDFYFSFLVILFFSKYCQIDLNRKAIQSYYTISVLFLFVYRNQKIISR